MDNALHVFSSNITGYIITLIISYSLVFIAFRFIKREIKLEYKKALFIVLLCIAVYIIIFTGLSWYKHDHFLTHIYDLGNMDQAIWNTIHGNPLRMTTFFPAETRLHFHAEPIFFLLAPLYAIWQNPKMLLLIQTIILGLGALPIFLITYEKLKNSLAGLFLSISYLLIPGLHQANLFDFHPLVLAATFILFGFYFLMKNKDSLCIIFFLLAITCREEIAVIIFLLGLYIFFWQKKKWSLLLSFAGLIWFLFVLLLVFPTFSPTGEPMQYAKYARYGDTPLQVISYIVTHPLSVFEVYGGLGKLNYILFLLTPVGLLGLFYPPLLLIGAFSFATIFLQDSPEILFGKFQYTVPLLAPIFLSAIYAIAWLARKIKRVSQHHTIIFATSVILLINIILIILHQQTSLSFSTMLQGPYSPAQIKAANGAISLIPEKATIVTTWRLGPHLAHRKNMYLIDTPYRTKADYIIVTKYTEVVCLKPPTELKTCEATPEQYQIYLNEIQNHPDYQLIYDQAHILVFKKNGSSQRIRVRVMAA